MVTRQEGRRAFNLVADLYDRIRPQYPAALFDDIVSLSGIPENGHILEIGCGTGQATLPLAKRAYHIDAIELGDQLAAIARAKLAGFPRVSIVKADFETVSPQRASYDLVVAATAIHWIDPQLRFQKPHDLLKPGGSIALFWCLPVQTEISQASNKALNEVYRRMVPEWTKAYRAPPHPDDITTEYEQTIPGSGLFSDLEIRRYPLPIAYSAETYVDLLATFHDHQLLEPEKQQRLFDGVRQVIETQFDGSITREQVALLYVARRK